MDFQASIIIMLIFFIASFLKGISGLGFSTICLPILTWYIDPKVSIPLIIIPSLSSNLFIMVQANKLPDALRRFWLLYISIIPGIFLGVSLLYIVNSSISRVMLGLILILYVGWSLYTQNLYISRKTEGWYAGFVGFCTGVITGLTGSQVMPVLPFMLSLKIDKDLFLQGINLSFTISSLIMLVFLGGYGFLNSQILTTSLLGIIPVAFGIYLGGKLRRYLPEEGYRKAVLIFLLLMGVGLLI